MKQVPEEDGFKCTYTNSVTGAVELLTKLVPHFIFIDMKFQGTEIVYMLQWVKEKLPLSEVNIFLYSNTHEHHHPYSVRMV